MSTQRQYLGPSLLILAAAAAVAKSLQSCPTLCDPTDGSLPGSPVPGILQTTTLEWVAISFSNAWKWKVKVKSLRLLATPWTAAYQAPPSMGFSRQEYWSGAPLPSPLIHATLPIFLLQILPLTISIGHMDTYYLTPHWVQWIGKHYCASASATDNCDNYDLIYWS